MRKGTLIVELQSHLVWSPIGPQIVARCASEGGVRLIIAPFIQRRALVYLLDRLPADSELKIITRWRSEDIASGVSDPFVYEECNERRIPLYLHPSIHLKIITMSSGMCFCGSANISGSGLGLHDCGNIEAGVWSSVAVGDWGHVYEIVNGSCLADQAVFEAAAQYRSKYLHHAPPLPPLELPASPPQEITLASLPATPHPNDLLQRCEGGDAQGEHEIDIVRMMHDLAVYGVDPNLCGKEMVEAVRHGFLKQPFVREIICYIRASGCLRFGEVTSWIHEHCKDVPVPYRWEVKEATHTLYNWLAFFIPEIAWSVPGRKSQVICWNESDEKNKEADGGTPQETKP